MAQITAHGIQSKGLTGFVTELEAAFRGALGQDLNLEPETPQGQLIGALGEVFAEAEELVVYNSNGLALATSQGRQLADWATFLGLPKIDGERSTVTVTLTGTPGTIVAAGSRVRTQAGAVFATAAQETIPATGSVDVLMRAAAAGPVVAAAGALTQIVDARAGWISATNAAAAAIGRNLESDPEYRRRYTGEVATHARDDLEAVRARILSEPGVTDALVRDNDTVVAKIVQGLTIGPGELLAIVEGGADEDVARAIALTKPAGGPTSGNRIVAFVHAQGFSVDIRFRRVDPIPVQIVAPLTALAGFPANGLATMRQNLVQWFAGAWPVPGPGIFDQSGVGIGEPIDLARVNTPLNAVPDHVLGRVVVRRKAGLLASVAVDAGGAGYTSAPDVAVAGTSGAAAVAAVRNGAVVRVDVTERGDGTLAAAPAIAFSGGGGGAGAAATATISEHALGSPDLDQRFTLDADDVQLSLSDAPLLLSASIAAKVLVLHYNLPLNAASVPATGDFRVTVNGNNRAIAAVAVAGVTVTLTMAVAVTAGQTVLLTYTPGASPLQDPAGHSLGALVAEPVQNNSA